MFVQPPGHLEMTAIRPITWVEIRWNLKLESIAVELVTRGKILRVRHCTLIVKCCSFHCCFECRPPMRNVTPGVCPPGKSSPSRSSVTMMFGNTFHVDEFMLHMKHMATATSAEDTDNPRTKSVTLTFNTYGSMQQRPKRSRGNLESCGKWLPADCTIMNGPTIC